MSNNSLVKDMKTIIDKFISNNNTQLGENVSDMSDHDNSELGDIDYSKIQRTLEELDLLKVHFSEIKNSVFQFLEMVKVSNNPHPQVKDLEIISDLLNAFQAKCRIFFSPYNDLSSRTTPQCCLVPCSSRLSLGLF